MPSTSEWIHNELIWTNKRIDELSELVGIVNKNLQVNTDRTTTTNHNLRSIYDENLKAITAHFKRIEVIIGELRSTNSAVTDPGGLLSTVNRNLITVNDNMVAQTDNLADRLQQLESKVTFLVHTTNRFKTELLENLKTSQNEALQILDKTRTDIVEELQESRTEIVRELKTQSEHEDSPSDFSTDSVTEQTRSSRGDAAFQDDLRSSQNLLVFQQHTTNLALNVIIDLLLPVTGQEYPYPPSLQQKLLQLAERMQEVQTD